VSKKTAEFFMVDERYMQRAIELAGLGIGNVAPNPMVGCVIVHNSKIIGEGYHRKYGDPHAEVNAINSVKQRELLKESILYVTLEPCSHHGKTPPCSDLIIREKIPHVVVGTIDPFAKVAGRGIKKMQDAGCRVDIDVLNKECADLNRRFFTFHEKKRPYIILKWAQTVDGFIDIERTAENFGQPTWISNKLSKTAVHKMRADECAILVGTNTAIKDNPSLTTRNWKGNFPLRLVVDRTLKLPSELALFNGEVPTLVFTEKEKKSEKNIQYLKIDFKGKEIEQILDDLYKRNILSLIVEGGKMMLESFIRKNFWDEARVFTGNKLFHKGVFAPQINATVVKNEKLDDSRLQVYRNG
jgi:diaminohydroxyphosphoribosylaminopyrimidine deaminase/5-amino-6-(5-phosphoribosylamino)uracil reductase